MAVSWQRQAHYDFMNLPITSSVNPISAKSEHAIMYQCFLSDTVPL